MTTAKEGAPTTGPMPPSSAPTEPLEDSGAGTAPRALSAIWTRIKEHKVVQWTAAYGAAAYTLLHIVEMVSNALDWPHRIVRVVTLSLFLAAPVAATLAWYHGHKARHRLSGSELAILTLLLFIAGSVLWVLGRPSQERARAIASAPLAPAPSAAPPEKSIAVLPFADLSERKDQEYFADGMAEEILDLLVKIPRLNVIGRTSSFQFKGHGEDLRSIGSKLGVAYVVEGSVRKVGSRIRVTAQLIDTQTAAHRWAESYDRDFGDVLALQDQIAIGIARALQLAVGADDTRPQRRLQSAEAYTLYLQGRSAYDALSDVPQAQSDFEQALALDPTFLRAAEALAWMHTNAVLNQKVQSRTGWQHAQEAADRAISIDADSAPAHAVLGLIHAEYQFDWAPADAEIAKALALNSRDPTTLDLAARLACHRGRYDEALRRIDASLSLDPLNPYAYNTKGFILYLAGDDRGAELALRKGLEISPTIEWNHNNLGWILVARGEHEAALKEMQAELRPGARDAGLSIVYHALGRRADSDAALERFKRELPYWPVGVALTHAYRGERDQAFAWLEKAYEQRDPDLLMWVKSHPFFASLRNDARYTAVLRKLNLLE
jgi:TolB-like protein